VISDLEDCSETEIQQQIRYLHETPVREIGAPLQTRKWVLKRGSIRTLAALGALKTEFGQIGPLIPTASDGERKFRIAEIVPLLRSNSGVDDELLRTIEGLVDKDSRGEVTYNVMVLLQGSEYIVKDGNKRAIAFYERRRESTTHLIDFPVFVVQIAQT